MQTLLTQVNDIFANETFVHEPTHLYEPIEYTLRLGGKRIRPLLLLAANQMMGGEPDEVRNAAIGIELFHNFTLLHDDLMDKSPLRRGQPTVYTKWDENTAILSGDTMFALAWRYFLVRPTPRLQPILQCFNDTAIEVCEGQQYDMNFETADQVTLDEYMEMIRLKTAVLLAGALKIGALYADAPETDIQHIYQFGIHLGLAFQLQDDLLDAYGDVATFGKQNYQDIRDNKKTYLYLKALEMSAPDQNAELRRLFAETPADPSAKVGRVLEIYNQLNIQDNVVQAVSTQFQLARLHLDAIQVHEAKKAPLRQIMETLLNRKK
ncbi:MAG: polyprenyl synthetase family protein [Bacteroidales bacterium]|nr:polyprenyl synthetase family protein [Bacteroidales bacterium]MBR3413157.1 polyprenyl synthetase family protein [Bacteroidales bacterium]